MYKKELRGYRKIYIGDIDLKKAGIQKGLFANKDLAQGEIIFHARGKLKKLIVKNRQDSERMPDALGIKPHYWIDPPPTNPLKYLNHSCSPNAGIKGSVTIVARKPIKTGEHITIDYSTTESDMLWDLCTDCHCGASNCRKIIKSIQYLPKNLYRNYLPYIPKSFQREFERYHTS